MLCCCLLIGWVVKDGRLACGVTGAWFALFIESCYVDLIVARSLWLLIIGLFHNSVSIASSKSSPTKRNGNYERGLMSARRVVLLGAFCFFINLQLLFVIYELIWFVCKVFRIVCI